MITLALLLQIGCKGTGASVVTQLPSIPADETPVVVPTPSVPSTPVDDPPADASSGLPAAAFSSLEDESLLSDHPDWISFEASAGD